MGSFDDGIYSIDKKLAMNDHFYVDKLGDALMPAPPMRRQKPFRTAIFIVGALILVTVLALGIWHMRGFFTEKFLNEREYLMSGNDVKEEEHPFDFIAKFDSLKSDDSKTAEIQPIDINEIPEISPELVPQGTENRDNLPKSVNSGEDNSSKTGGQKTSLELPENVDSRLETHFEHIEEKNFDENDDLNIANFDDGQQIKVKGFTEQLEEANLENARLRERIAELEKEMDTMKMQQLSEVGRLIGGETADIERGISINNSNQPFFVENLKNQQNDQGVVLYEHLCFSGEALRIAHVKQNIRHLNEQLKNEWPFFVGFPESEESPREEEQDDCIELPDEWKGIVSSAETNGACVILFSDSNCREKIASSSVTIRRGSAWHNNFAKLDFNDLAKSLKFC